MRKMKAVGFLITFALVLVGTLSLGVWAEITLDKDGVAQANWWSCADHPGDVCDTCPTDFCDPAYLGDYWSVELGTHAVDDWAFMRFACSTEVRGTDESRTFLASEIDSAGFRYKMHEVTSSDCGPAMAFDLYDRTPKQHYLLISELAPETQTASCAVFNAYAVDWFYGEWDGETIDSFVADNPGAPVAITAIPAALLASEVHAALVVMGLVGDTDRVAGGIGTGIAIIDDMTLTWTNGVTTTAYGGVYKVEPAWPNRIGFEDWALVPGVDGSPREFDLWCSTDHCMPADDLNLWFYPNDAPVYSGNIPQAVSDEHGILTDGTFNGEVDNHYALYFGNDDLSSTDWNYNVGDSAVGCITSPFNELNPEDRYVTIDFDYLREVEQELGDEYDWTYVQVNFYDASGNPAWTDVAEMHGNGAWSPWDVDNPGDTDGSPATCSSKWKTVWYMDSTDANVDGWQHASIDHYLDGSNESLAGGEYRIQVPPRATRMKIRFGFNSVDGAMNDQLGWFVDNIVKMHGPSPVGCNIDDDTLPQGEVDDKYPGIASQDSGYQLEPTGEGYTWSVVSVTKDGARLPGLPGRLALTADGLLYGTPEAGTAGTYYVTLKLLCRDGEQTKTFTLVIRAPGSATAGNIIFEDDFLTAVGWILDDGSVFGAGPVACGDINLWHETGKVKYAFDDPNQMVEMGHVAFFGTDDLGRPLDAEDPNYCSSRVKGNMRSPRIDVSDPAWDGEELVVAFKSWRQVEDFPDADYDKTWVTVQINDGSLQTVWFKSSADASVDNWTWEEANTGIILDSGDKVYVRFHFDSVDGYQNGATGEAYGWLVDELRVYAGSTTMRILDCPPSEASVGEYYREEVNVSGGPTGSYNWEILPDANALPAGLSLEPDTRDPRVAYVTGVPREATRVPAEFTIRVSGGSQSATIDCSIQVTESVTLLTENFETDPTWSGDGLWHITGDAGVAGVDDLGQANHAAYYGQDDAGSPNYNTGLRTTGSLTLVSPQIAITGLEAVRVRFEYWREVESLVQGGYDVASLQVKYIYSGTEGDWETKWSIGSETPSMEEWRDAVAEFEVPADATFMLVRFSFDSADKWYNNYVGLLVDNLKVSSIAAADVNPMTAMRAGPAELRGVPADLQVMNLPNPVTDVHTTTFMVRSADVEAMRIEIYDTSGALVFEEEVPGNELVWHTENDFGEYLSNGIYLYHAYVMMDGQWIETGFQKLVILR